MFGAFIDLLRILSAPRPALLPSEPWNEILPPLSDDPADLEWIKQALANRDSVLYFSARECHQEFGLYAEIEENRGKERLSQG